MISAEDGSFKAVACYNDTLSRVPVGMMDFQVWDGGNRLADARFSNIQTNMIYDVASNMQTDNHQYSSSIDPLIDLFEGQSYVSLNENSGLPFYRLQESIGGKPLDNFPVNPWLSNEEIVPSGTFLNLDQAELQQSLQAVNVNYAHGFQSKLKRERGTCYLASTSMKGTRMETKCLKSVPKKLKKRSEAESRRKSIISQKLQVLHDDLPETLKDKQATRISILDDLIDHIKYLQLQLKELSKSRLESKSNSVPLMFIEGYGYYHPAVAKFGEPLDEFLSSLFEDDPSVVRKVLENYGLYTVPMASFYEFMCTKA